MQSNEIYILIFYIYWFWKWKFRFLNHGILSIIYSFPAGIFWSFMALFNHSCPFLTIKTYFFSTWHLYAQQITNLVNTILSPTSLHSYLIFSLFPPIKSIKYSPSQKPWIFCFSNTQPKLISSGISIFYSFSSFTFSLTSYSSLLFLFSLWSPPQSSKSSSPNSPPIQSPQSSSSSYTSSFLA